MRCRLAVTLYAAVSFAPWPALAFDCNQARTALEKAVCADTGAKGADDGLDNAFRTLKAMLGPAQAASLLANQRAWLKERNAACGGETSPASCIASRDTDRSRILGAQPTSGPGLAQPLIPVIIHRQGSRTDVTTDILLFRFADTGTPAAKALNPIVDKMIADAPVKKDAPDDRDWSTEISSNISYASKHLLSIAVESWDYSGGAHGNGGMSAINIDPQSGRLLTYADLADSNGTNALVRMCLDQIVAQKHEKGIDRSGADEHEDEKNILGILVDLKSWIFTADKAQISFDPYTVGSYAEGTYSCDIPYTRLRPLAKPGFPLP